MRSLRYFALVALTLLGLILAPRAFAQGEGWTGKTIFVKKHKIKIGHADDQGRHVYLGELNEIHYRVLAENNGWIQVKTKQGIVGWFDKNEAVLLEDAAGFFTERLRQNPNNASAYQARAEVWQLKGELDIAIKDIGKALRLDPRDHNFISRGNIFLRKKDYDKAIVDFTEAIRLDPQEAISHNNRGQAWNMKKDYDKAIADCSEAIRLDPKFVAPYRNRGNAWYAKKDHDKAIEDYSEALRLDPKDVGIYHCRGNAWYAKKDYDKAIDDYSEALHLDPKVVGIYHCRGNAWYAKKDFNKAIDNYSEAIRINPSYMRGYWARAAARERLQQHGDAVADFSEALRLDPKNAQVLNNLAWLLTTCSNEKVRDGKRAVTLAKHALELSKNDPNHLDTLAAALAETGDFAEAVRVQEQAMRDGRLANDSGVRFRLELYRQNQPYRQGMEQTAAK